MYRDSYQRGMLTVFYSCGSKPLAIWETRTQDGYISRFLDQDIKSMVVDICGTNISTTYMTCPKGKQVLGIHMPFLVMIVKNLKKYFSFEVTILDETSTRRRFRVSNFQSTTQILPLCTVMPIGLSDGWNQIQFNLAEFTRRAYQKQFVEVQKLKINANIRLRRIYFAERLISEDQLPPEYRLYFPIGGKAGKKKKAEDEPLEAIQPSTSHHEAVMTAVVEQPPSVTAVLRLASKASIHSVKKLSSRESRKSASQVITEVTGEELAGTGSATEIAAAVEADVTPVTIEGEGAEGDETAAAAAQTDAPGDGYADGAAAEPVETDAPADVEVKIEDTSEQENADPLQEHPPQEEALTE